MWPLLFSWLTVAVVVPVLIGIGFSVMSMNPPQAALAQACFSLAALVLGARLGWWLVFESPDARAGQIIIFAFLIFGGIGTLWIQALRWVGNSRRLTEAFTTAETTKRKQEPANAQKQPTLTDLFKGDLSSFMKATDEDRIGVQLKSGGALRIKTQVYMDFAAKTQFVGFYVPSSQETYQACLSLVDAVQETIQGLPKRIAVQAGYRGERNSLEELVFSGRVLLYHEDFLSIQQKAKIIDLYVAKHFDVQFRGPDYLADQVIAWHHQHDAKVTK